MTRFRVATYNVHKCRGMDWRVNVARIAKVVGEIEADVFALQEVFAGQTATLAGGLHCQHVFAPSRKLHGEDYGNAVLSHFPILDSEQYDLTVTGREPRNCLRVESQLADGGPLHVFAVHLGTSFLERRRQAGKLLSEQFVERPELRGARILAGDFNEWTRGQATTLLSKHLKSADLKAHLRRSTTYPGLLPFLHLDHIYYDPAFRLTGMHLHKTPASLLASDHLPLVADFCLERGGEL